MGIGGTEQVIRQLVDSLPDSMFTNIIVCIDGEVGELGKQLEQLGTEIIAFKRNPGLDFSLVKKIRHLIDTGSIDIVHCHQYTPWVYGTLAAVGKGKTVVFTEHGRFHPDRYRYKALLANRLLAMVTDSIVAISEATRSALARYEFIPKRRIEVIYNGIKPLKVTREDSERTKVSLGVPLGVPVLGTVARLDPVKNQGMMLDAFARVLERHPECRMVLVGDGPDRKMLEDRANILKITNRVIFTGFKTEPGLYLSIFDIFILSSHTEGTSMTLLEAMSLGIPCVVTDVGGNPEIVENEKSGILVPSRSDEQLAGALCRLIEDRSLRSYLGDAGLRRFEEGFSAAAMTDKYQSLYLQLLER
ncbi:glycosyltransferase [Marinobacter salinus]|uniref:Glycosyltransferase n=2 Tax=Marinobacter salinus TaxID=1874317 RepID=A0A1D9GRI6_9GAMM|nr:glycosyltransferase [Marinobacter salinus]